MFKFLIILVNLVQAKLVIKDDLIVYLLKLKHDKYYVGTTNNIEKTMFLHKMNISNNWIYKHPIEKLETVEYIINKKECNNINYCNVADCWIYKIMYHKGIDSVRGGSWPCIELFGDSICQTPIINKCNKSHRPYIDDFISVCWLCLYLFLLICLL